ncbi:MAG: DUF4153 domain-containing protein, partial [Ruminococcus sp.]|nr:DUF4153 domain-containing protein [Ruminococcus sp.]
GTLCFSRPDALIAKYNIEMYNSGRLEELDTSAIKDMSDDAVLELVKSCPDLFDETDFRYRKNNNISSLLLNQIISYYSN